MTEEMNTLINGIIDACCSGLIQHANWHFEENSNDQMVSAYSSFGIIDYGIKKGWSVEVNYNNKSLKGSGDTIYKALYNALL